MREAASDVWSIAHERAATKQTAGKAAAHPGFDEMPRLRRCSPCEYAQAIRRGSRLASGAISSETRLMRGPVSACLTRTGQAARAKLVGGPPVAVIGWGGRDRTYECRNQNPVPYHLATPQGNRSRFEISGCREAPQRMAVKRARHEPGAPRPHHQRQRLQRGSFGGKRGENATSGSRHADRDCAGRLA